MLDLQDTCDFDIGQACREVTNLLNACYSMVKNMCDNKRKYRKLISIMKYIRQDFLRTKDHFLKAIDHVKEEPTQRNSTNRNKRSTEKEQLIQEAYEQIDYNEKDFIGGNI